MNIYTLDRVSDFISSLTQEDDVRITTQVKAIAENKTGDVIIKTLKGKVKELIINEYRIVFFIKNGTVYLVDGFKKKSQKTPKRIIERAERIHLTIY